MPPRVPSLVPFPSPSHGAFRPRLVCPLPQKLLLLPWCFAALTSATLVTFASVALVESHQATYCQWPLALMSSSPVQGWRNIFFNCAKFPPLRLNWLLFPLTSAPSTLLWSSCSACSSLPIYFIAAFQLIQTRKALSFPKVERFLLEPPQLCKNISVHFLCCAQEWRNLELAYQRSRICLVQLTEFTEVAGACGCSGTHLFGHEHASQVSFYLANTFH